MTLLFLSAATATFFGLVVVLIGLAFLRNDRVVDIGFRIALAGMIIAVGLLFAAVWQPILQ